MRRTWMPISILLIAALLASTIVLAALYATKPTRSEVLAGLTSGETAAISALAPVLAFSPEDVPGEVGNSDDPFIDDLGRKVFIPGNSSVERIVSQHPAADEVLFLLGEDDKLVGISEAWVVGWITTPEELVENMIYRASLEPGEEGYIATFAWYPQYDIYPAPEAILDLDPDVLFIFGYSAPDFAKPIEDAEVPIIYFAPENLGDVLYDIVLVGKIMGKYDEVAALAEEMRERIIAIGTQTLAVGTRPTVFYETGYNGGLWTTGEGSFVSSLVFLAGGDDIGVVVSSNNANIDPEYVLSSDPDMLIFGDASYLVWTAYPDPKDRPGWAALTGDFYMLTEEQIDRISRPGPGLIDGLEILAGIIHPELS